MAKRKNYRTATKVAAAEALQSGQRYSEVAKRYGVSAQTLYTWSKQHKAGLLSDSKVKISPPDAPSTPERVFDERVRQAIGLLRRAEDEVERLKKERKIKEADNAHLYAMLALRLLQGDNGR